MFYGWVIVGACVLIGLYTGGVVFYGFTAVFEPIADDLGWSYTQISLAASLRGLEMGLLSPVIGALADRWGPRRLVAIGAAATAAGLLVLSSTRSLPVFYLSFVLLTVGMSCCTQTVLMTAVANWFRRKVGLASGIALCGFGLGGLLVPVMVRLIESYGWRSAMVVLGVGALVLVLPLSALIRHRPEQYGYLPDGEHPKAGMADGVSGALPGGGGAFTAKAVLRTGTFWRMVVAFTCHAVLVSATVTHVMPYLSSGGIGRSVSGLVASGIPVVSIGGRLGLGWLGDRLDRRRLAGVALAMMGTGLLCFEYVSSSQGWLLVPFLILFGVGYGGSVAMRVALTTEFYGRASFGAVFGLLIGLNMLGSIVGPTLAGWVFDSWGSYRGVWLGFAGLSAAAVAAVLTIRRPVPSKQGYGSG